MARKPGIDTRFDHLLGKPHCDFGRGPNDYDCYGAVIEAGRIVGVDIPDYGSVPTEDNDEDIERIILLHHHEARKLDIPREGAVLLFYDESLLHISHMAIMISAINFIHSRRSSGVQVSRFNNPYWQRRLEGIYWWTRNN